jgi:REP element-mobilizing transposase RayT
MVMFAAMITNYTQIPRSKQQMEWEAERLFKSEGRFTHLHTPALETDMIFQTKEEYYVAIAYMAMAAAEARVEVLAYALMSNHFHFILKGKDTRKFFNLFLRRLSLYLSRHGRPGVLNTMQAQETEITSLRQFRNEVAYVIRNPFVVRDDVHIFANIQTSGFLYFNPLLQFFKTEPMDGMTIREKQAMVKSKDTDLLKGLSTLGPMVNPASFVNYKLVESLFVSARQFIHWILKNVELQVETAFRLGEQPNLSDEELLSLVFKLCRSQFGCTKPAELNREQQLSLITEIPGPVVTK